MFADYFKPFSCCCEWKARSTGPWRARCLCPRQSFHPQDAVPRGLSRPRNLVPAARAHAKSSGCRVPPLRCESRLCHSHECDWASSSVPKAPFSLPVERGHRDNNTEQLGQLKGTVCGQPLARRLGHSLRRLLLLSKPEKRIGRASGRRHVWGETRVTQGC